MLGSRRCQAQVTQVEIFRGSAKGILTVTEEKFPGFDEENIFPLEMSFGKGQQGGIYKFHAKEQIYEAMRKEFTVFNIAHNKCKTVM